MENSNSDNVTVPTTCSEAEPKRVDCEAFGSHEESSTCDRFGCKESDFPAHISGAQKPQRLKDQAVTAEKTVPAKPQSAAVPKTRKPVVFMLKPASKRQPQLKDQMAKTPQGVPAKPPSAAVPRFKKPVVFKLKCDVVSQKELKDQAAKAGLTFKFETDVTTPPQPAITAEKAFLCSIQQTVHENPVNQTPNLRQISEYDSQALLANRDNTISRINKENAVLLNQVQHLKHQLKNEATKSWNQYLEERAQWLEERSYILALRQEEISYLINNCNWDMEKERSQWAEEKSYILASHEEEISCLINNCNWDMEKERSQWAEEKSYILASHKKAISSLIKTWKEKMGKERFQWQKEKDRLVSEHLKTSDMKAVWIQTVEQKSSQWAEEKSCILASHKQETSCLINKCNQDMEKERSQWQEEKSHLRSAHMEEIFVLNRRLLNVQEDLEKQKLEWHEEKSSLPQCSTNLKDVVDQHNQDQDELMTRLVHLKTQIAEIQREQEEKDKKNKSLKKRFSRLFKSAKVLNSPDT